MTDLGIIWEEARREVAISAEDEGFSALPQPLPQERGY